MNTSGDENASNSFIHLFHYYFSLNIAIISQSHYTAQSLSLLDRLQNPSSRTSKQSLHRNNQAFSRLLWLVSGLLQGYGSNRWSYLEAKVGAEYAKLKHKKDGHPVSMIAVGRPVPPHTQLPQSCMQSDAKIINKKINTTQIISRFIPAHLVILKVQRSPPLRIVFSIRSPSPFMFSLS